MNLILAGVLLWSILHLLPASAQGLRRSIIEKTGIGPYKLLFTLLILFSIGLMVAGWRSAGTNLLYVADWLPLQVVYVLMYIGIFLIVASSFNTRVKRLIRHPQLTGFAIWSGTHVLVNGESRAVLLFGGLLLWSIVEILALNRRDGEWHKPHAAARLHELKPLAASIALFALLFYIHPWLSGKALPL